MDHLILVVIGFPDLGIQCRALHALPVHAKVALCDHAGLFIQFARHLLIAGGGQDRFTLKAVIGLLEQFLGCAVDAVRFRIPAPAENR